MKKRKKKANCISNMFSIISDARYTKIFAISFVLFFGFYTFLYGIWKIPLLEIGFNRTSTVELLDYAYIFSITIMSSLLISMIKYERAEKLKSGIGAVGIGGTTTAFVSAICPSCQGIAILAFGGTAAALPLAFLIPYLWILQAVSLMILGLALYLKADNIYTEKCIGCDIGTKNILKNNKL